MSNKKSIIFSIIAGMAVAASASASNPGAYIGGQLGWGTVHQDGINFNEFTKHSAKNSGLAGRLFTGYQFNQNFAAELGYTRFQNGTASGVETENFGGINYAESAEATLKAHAVDLVAKGILPLENGFSLYGKVGAAYLYESIEVSDTFSIANYNYSYSGTASAHKILPTFGAGVTYDINQNVSTDLSWTRIQKVGNANDLKSTDFVAVGLAYHFG